MQHFLVVLLIKLVVEMGLKAIKYMLITLLRPDKGKKMMIE